MQHSRPPILVLGSTGKTGRRIVARLRALNHLVREGSRRASPAFDWDEPSTWPAVLAGAERVYIAFPLDLAAPHAAPTIEAFLTAAIEARVKHVVLLSGRGEANAVRCENLVRASGLDFTLVRASWFAQNFNEGQLLPAVLDGVLPLPAGSVREPFVDADDIADVAVAALSEDGHAGQLYEVTGPRLLTFADAAAEMASASGRRVAYVPISLGDFHEGLLHAAGADFARLMTDLCAEVFDGRNESLGDGVQRALGRQPADFSDFCRAAARSGVWNPAPTRGTA